MKEVAGRVFSIAKDNVPIPGCTVSKEISGGDNYISIFSMAEDTDISAEIFPYHKLVVVSEGRVTVYKSDGSEKILEVGDGIVTEVDTPVGFKTRKDIMNKAIKAGQVFKFAELISYQDGKIVNMDIVHNDKMKFVVMAFDAGTGLSEHSAPGEAIVFALDGEGIIGYEGTDHVIKAGECFHFAKAGRHYVKAEKNFKMALLLTLE